MMNTSFYQRIIEPRIAEAEQDASVVLLAGLRQVENNLEHPKKAVHISM
jgi:hypothetical protein